MTKTKRTIEDFIETVEESYKDFVRELSDILLSEEYKQRIQMTKNGLSVSYTKPNMKWRLLGLSTRDNQLVIHINAEHYKSYPELLNNMPEVVLEHLDNTHTCLKLKDVNKCWKSCEPGYDFKVGDRHYQACRYDCFKMKVNKENIPFFLELVEREISERMVANYGISA